MIKILGPFEAPADVGEGKPRAVLARLALDGGSAVPAHELVEDIWGSSPPPSAPKVLQAHVSGLRKALGRSAIETRGGGYALRLDTDLRRFEELARRARSEPDAATRARTLREALALWRGEPLAEIREPFASRAVVRLTELRLEALSRRVDADLDLGEGESLVPELHAVVQREPLRERPRAHLMRALYRAGRQAEALAVYRDGRALLVAELGIDPGPELQELERAILHQDPSLAAHVEEPHDVIVCVGVAPIQLLAPLERDLVIVELGAGLVEAPVIAGARCAAFTTSDPVADTVRLAREQNAELLIVRDAPAELLEGAPCDVALSNGMDMLGDGPLAVAFGGGREEWPALELGAWLARAHGRTLKLLGTEADDDRRDASRALAGASLALQRFAGVSVLTALIPPGPDAITGAAVVCSLPRAELDATRRALLAAPFPVLLVHGGLRPSGLAPAETRTRFRWSLAQ
ncbi:MAG: AfsR/SARP family transcriptional regulator [Gaiellaceae bacterium]